MYILNKEKETNNESKCEIIDNENTIESYKSRVAHASDKDFLIGLLSLIFVLIIMVMLVAGN